MHLTRALPYDFRWLDRRAAAAKLTFAPPLCLPIRICAPTVKSPADWAACDDPRQVERTFLCPAINEIFDMQWSPDSNFLVLGALDSKVCSPRRFSIPRRRRRPSPLTQRA